MLFCRVAVNSKTAALHHSNAKNDPLLHTNEDLDIRLPAGRQGFRIFNCRSRIGKLVQVGIDFTERIGQEKNPNGNQKKATDDGDHPHISFYFIKGGKE
jgi:hypothetical protein